METRRLILEQAGHSVIQASSEPEVVRACSTHAIQVAVISQTIEPQEKLRAFALIREHCPSAKVLSLYVRGLGKALPDADDWLEVPVNVPASLAERVSQLAALVRQA
jgi:CheY-like chemotaxis protein